MGLEVPTHSPNIAILQLIFKREIAIHSNFIVMKLSGRGTLMRKQNYGKREIT